MRAATTLAKLETKATRSATSSHASSGEKGEVTSAVALDGAQQARILADLTQRYGDRIVVRFSVDESLIGGLIVRMGDRVLDNSLRTRLAALQRNMIVG